jgi:hypothetical protein
MNFIEDLSNKKKFYIFTTALDKNNFLVPLITQTSFFKNVFNNNMIFVNYFFKLKGYNNCAYLLLDEALNIK